MIVQYAQVQPMIRRPTTISEMTNALAAFWSEESLRRGLAFQPRPSDVIISPFGKSGTTWLQQIVHGLRTRGSMDFDEITAETPWIERAHDMGWDLEAPQRAEPRAFKSHLSYYDVPKGCRCICSIRDPHDVLVSWYRFFEGWWFEPQSISLETFTREFHLARAEEWGYWHHLISWWEQRHNENVLLLSFERMKADLPGTVRQVATFMGIESDDELIEIVVRQSSLPFMLAHKSHFDDHIIRQAAERRVGLPANGASAKVTAGASKSARYHLSPSLKHELDEVWKRTVEARFGFSDYDALRKAIERLNEA